MIRPINYLIARRWERESGFGSDNSDYPRITATEAAQLFPNGSDAAVGLVHHTERGRAVRHYRRNGGGGS
ncbi:MAG: hypothetical protein AAF962_08845 [Actinomycetota bacterium]